MRACARRWSRCSRPMATPRGFSPAVHLAPARRTLTTSGPASPILTRGMRLGVFDVESFVGAGGMGEVYRARDTRLDRHVAIKVLSPDAATDPRSRVRFALRSPRHRAPLASAHLCAP